MKRSFQNVSGEETLKACFKVTKTALAMLRASIKNQNPEYSEKEVEEKLIKIIRMQKERKDRFARKLYAGRA
ncbi:hypothetical protein [Candidatus Pyrohabitans sp.]